MLLYKVPANRPFKRAYSVVKPKALQIVINGKKYPQDSFTNISSHILSYLDRHLLQKPNHPLNILVNVISTQFPRQHYEYFVDFSPVVSTLQNFDDLGMPEDHPGRSKSDTFYINSTTVLRTHTSAHQLESFKLSKKPGFVVFADVYRRDEIDSKHYPVFHQMEATWLWAQNEKDICDKIYAEIQNKHKFILKVEDQTSFTENPMQTAHTEKQKILKAMIEHLKFKVENTFSEIFSRIDYLEQDIKLRWTNDRFTFTSPSFQLEIFWKNKWIELLGCGIVHQNILNQSEKPNHMGWALGLGLDRLAMILFDIPDIRLLWSQDVRFTSQFQSNKISRFIPFSKYPVCYKDISFWVQGNFDQTNFMQLVRETAGDIVESVELIDEYVDKRSMRKSLCFRINYQSMERSLKSREVHKLLNELRKKLTSLDLELR